MLEGNFIQKQNSIMYIYFFIIIKGQTTPQNGKINNGKTAKVRCHLC